MECKQCHCFIDQSIEGELICSRCWTLNQQDDESRACDAAIDEYLREERQNRAEIAEILKEYHEMKPIPDNVCCVCEEPIYEGVYHLCFSQSFPGPEYDRPEQRLTW